MRCSTNFSLVEDILFYYEQPSLVPKSYYPNIYYPNKFRVSEYHRSNQFLYQDLIIFDVYGLNGSLYSCQHYEESGLSNILELILPGMY